MVNNNAGNRMADLEQEYIDKRLNRVFHDRLSPEIRALQVEQSEMEGGVRLSLAIKNDLVNLSEKDLEDARDLTDKLQRIYKEHQVAEGLKSKVSEQTLQQSKLPPVLQEEPVAKVSSSWFGFWKQKDKSAPAPEPKLGVHRTTTPKKPGSP